MARWMLLLLLLALPAQAASAPQTWAVVVGVDEYRNPGVTDLEFAEEDARLFAEALRGSAGVPSGNVFLMTTGQAGDAAPTRTNLAFRFDWLRRHVGPDDTMVVYFSGHGVEIEGRSFLLTEEADARSLLTLEQSALQARDLFAWLSATSAGRTLVVVDACRNDPMSGRGSGDNVLGQGLARDLSVVDLSSRPGAASPPASATLFACSAGQRSWEWADRGHGFFTWFLVEGLNGKAAGSDGQVTLASLVRYLQQEVPQASGRHAMQTQAPWLRYEGPGADGWVLSRPGTAAAVATTASDDERVRQAEERARQAEERARRAEQDNPQVADREQVRDLLSRLGGLESSIYGGSTGPRVIRVGQSAGAPYLSVARAAAEAPPGARIVIGPGVYTERVVVDRPLEIVGEGNVVLRSAEGPVIEVRTTDRVLVQNVTLEGPSPVVSGQAVLQGVRTP